ncbi:class D sortase [Alicyclobacillus fastidiosus]|uniref:Class D sortase n=1 Tax=Alicyclobacillus fastidiosus TaxID=392011 RepID=A0ABV5AEL8_9BACL|nr:class D sortase [Alicyclobacillus fastidiosus]WEH09564.1 class D sortase [Alicyclobacillus fastidiosus]
MSIIVVARVPYFYIRSSVEGKALLKEAAAKNKLGAPTNAIYKTGDLIGRVSIPKLGLEAPLLEGTDDAQLAVGAGHLASSVLPGRNGTSIIAAHNATWFHRINDLTAGDAIEVDTSYGSYSYVVTGSRIESVGQNVINTIGPTIALEACYPLNALYLTSERYFVFAKEVNRKSKTYQSSPPAHSNVGYNIDVPLPLREEGITLKTNPVPMGNLSYTGTPSLSYQQSDMPLMATDALVQLYIAWVHANADRNTQWMKLLAGSNTPTTFYGVSLARYHYLSLLNVTLHVTGDDLETLEATTNVRISHRFHVDIHASVHNGQLHIDSMAIDQY